MSSPVFNENTLRAMERGGSFRYDEHGNPVVDEQWGNTQGAQPFNIHVTTPQVFSVNGALVKTAFLLAVVTVSAIASALLIPLSLYIPIFIASLVITLGLAFWIAKNPKQARIISTLYAAIEGVTVGMFSLILAQSFGLGIIAQALLGTVAVTVSMLFLYATHIIKVTDKFRTIVYGATLGIFVMYMIGIIGRLAFGAEMAFLFGNSWLSIGISILVIGVAALNLAVDFDLIERMKNQQVAKYYEWYAAFGLMVTLVWLYIEILRLLAKLQSRD
ncbi:Bax inhibitor-1/YccA family protein [Stomatohabitans albus]|uniref:Bax inhibitor-1/YccA family protein n=1 Tax=Stomatohabitans albus TaxID=3110766 RepID=UPI00300D5C23